MEQLEKLVQLVRDKKLGDASDVINAVLTQKRDVVVYDIRKEIQ